MTSKTIAGRTASSWISLFSKTFFRTVTTILILSLSISFQSSSSNTNNYNSHPLVLVHAMYAEDAGVLDFVVSTTGHGPFTSVYPFVSSTAEGIDEPMILTGGSDSDSTTSSSCYIAARKQSDGELVWRRNVCSSSSSSSTQTPVMTYDLAVDITTENKIAFTVDTIGVVRAWSLEDGGLIWDTVVSQGNEPSTGPLIWTVPAAKDDGSHLVAVSSNEDLVLLDATTGNIYDTIHGLTSINGGGNLKSGESLQWLTVYGGERTNIFRAVLAVTTKDGTVSRGGDLYLAEIEIGNDKPKSVQALNHVRSPLLATSLQIDLLPSGESNGIAISQSGTSLLYFSLGGGKNKFEEIPAQQLSSKFSTLTGAEATSIPSVIRVHGKETFESESSSMVLYSMIPDNTGKWEESSESTLFAAEACPELNLILALTDGSTSVYRYDSTGKLAAVQTTGDMFVPDGDTVSLFSVLSCSSSGASLLMSTERGSTAQLSISLLNNESVEMKVDWTAEEGLSSISSTIVLDATHLGFDDLVEEQDVVAKKLSLSGRLKSQWNSVMNLIPGSSMVEAVSFSIRDHLFGFVKVAALLSPTAHRIWGMDTSGESHRGSIRWSLDLPKDATWHTMVHGTTNSASSMHGINGGTHSKEILVLSARPSTVEWMCIDGTSGAVNAQGDVAFRSSIMQVMPVYGSSTGGCRQAALLLHEDLTLSAVPSDAETVALAKKHLTKAQNGLFAHTLDKSSNKLESYQVAFSAQNERFEARPTGQASFRGEEIVEVAYPIRHEAVQSMSTILGDDSLLLKYINPHMAVVVTMIVDEENQSVTPMATTLENVGGGKKPRKPVGAGTPEPGTVTNKDDKVPNMFINVVDTVSGRVLYRTSHSQVDRNRKISAMIAENWIVYTFTNEATRRTEIGVLTLHEGMIDKKGLTFFSTPDQSTTFSSLDARESKPVVLAKTYTFSKAVTALGVTSTRQGISSQNILFAGADGSLTAMPRIMLETRRPLGEAKPNEKKEGLVPYRELIPAISLQSLTYNHTIEPFHHVVASDTSLESQSLVIGFGGPDLFVVRTSPTKGFDLLPETFNKALVGLVTVGIVIAFIVVKRMASLKGLQMGWM